MVPLAYSLASFSDEGLQRARRALPYLRELGFTWVTITPTFGVRDGAVLSLIPALRPDPALLAQTIQEASEAGFHLRLEPHLDWESTLTGGPYQWRRRMYFSPTDEQFGYASELLLPLHQLGAQLRQQRPQQRVQLTLASELDSATIASAPNWTALVRSLPADSGVELGHKVNHDFFSAGDGILEEIRGEQRARQLPAWRSGEFRAAVTDAREYLSTLDYVSTSFYPQLPLRRSDEWWRSTVTEDQLEEVRVAMRLALAEQAEPIQRLNHPAYSVGEFGLGSTDPLRSYDFNHRTFLDETGQMNPGAREMRRKFYRGFLLALAGADGLLPGQPACFWTVTHFDIVQALYREGWEAFADDDLIAAIRDYNAAAAL